MSENATGNSLYKIGLAGCGKMGSAMAKAWLSSNIISHMDVLDPSGLPPDLSGDPRISLSSDESSFAQKALNWDVLIIAVKPQIISDFCGKIKTYMPLSLPVVSIAAGQTLSFFARAFGPQQPVIRTMPNTPAAIGKGMTVACSNPATNDAQKTMVTTLMNALGKTIWMEQESSFDAVTAVSGSGPAYVFYLIETMAQAGIDAGLDPDLAMTLARQTIIGSASLAEGEADISAAKLRENVTSPNGTTAAALSVLMNGTFQKIMSEAIAKAAARSKELSN